MAMENVYISNKLSHFAQKDSASGVLLRNMYMHKPATGYVMHLRMKVRT